MNNPFTSKRVAAPPRWWENPARPCKDRPEFSDVSLIRPTATETKRMIMRDLASLCTHCPVLKECRADMLTYPDEATHGIRAGKIRV